MLLVLLFVMLIAVLILLGSLCLFGGRLLRLLFCLGSFGLFLVLLLGLFLGLLLSGLRLLLCGLGAVQGKLSSRISNAATSLRFNF